MVAPLILVGGAAALGGIALLISKKGHSAATHQGALGNAPIVVGTPGGEILPLPGRPTPVHGRGVAPDAPIPQRTPPGSFTPTPIGKTPGGNAVVSICNGKNPETGKNTAVFDLATNGLAVPQAHALFDYLTANRSADDTPEFHALVRDFTRAHNGDSNAMKLTEVLPTSGVYNDKVSASLTMYTGQPFAPAANVPPPPQVTLAQIKDPATAKTLIGNAAYSSSNLFNYMKVHGNDKTPELKRLIKTFQHDVNNDPMFPGPVSFSGIKVIKNRLDEDGSYGPKTKAALAVTWGSDTP